MRYRTVGKKLLRKIFYNKIRTYKPVRIYEYLYICTYSYIRISIVMSKHNVILGGLISAAALTLLYAVEGYIAGIFSGAPSLAWRSLFGNAWYLTFIGFNVVSGLVFVIMYTQFAKGFRGSRGKRGMQYGLGAWAISSVVYPPLVIVNVNLPAWLILGWAVSTLVNTLVLGYIVGLLVDVRE